MFVFFGFLGFILFDFLDFFYFGPLLQRIIDYLSLYKSKIVEIDKNAVNYFLIQIIKFR